MAEASRSGVACTITGYSTRLTTMPDSPSTANKLELREAIARKTEAVRALERQHDAAERELRRLEAELAAREAAASKLGLEARGRASPTPATATEKVALFRSLFRGRVDLFPRLWTNATSGRTGYAPACGNEWVRGVCEKPRVRCGECSNQAFLPVCDRVLRDHLQGGPSRLSHRATAGVHEELGRAARRGLLKTAPRGSCRPQGHSGPRRAPGAGDRPLHRRGLRRRATRHPVPDHAGLLAGNGGAIHPGGCIARTRGKRRCASTTMSTIAFRCSPACSSAASPATGRSVTNPRRKRSHERQADLASV